MFSFFCTSPQATEEESVFTSTISHHSQDVPKGPDVSEHCPDVLSDEDGSFVRQYSPLCDWTSKDQTMIVFDWDDTIFPTTFLKATHQLDFTVPLARQGKDVLTIRDIEMQVEQTMTKAQAILTLACSLGNVIIVTLAVRPWISNVCKLFAPSMEDMIYELGITIVYAREYGPTCMMPDMMVADQINPAWVDYWTSKKAAAISTHLEMFYSRYEGQSWKNVISIGDSDFERFGTEHATSGYLEKATSQASLTAIEGAGASGALVVVQETDTCAWRHRICQEIDTGEKILKLRAKTIKMVAMPSPEKLCAQLDVIAQLMPSLVKFDSGIDINLDHVESPSDRKDLLMELNKPSLATRRSELPTRLRSS